jgi:hypothetical protein
VKFNPRHIKPKPNALKTKSTSNIQAIKLNIFHKFYEKENFEIFKKAKFKDDQLISYFFFQFQFHTIIKNGWQVQLHFTNNILKSLGLS